MSVLVTEVRASAYADSIVLMQLQSDLQRLEGVLEAGVVMGTAVNLDLLKASQLLDETAMAAGPEDLVIAIRAQSEDQAAAALEQVGALMKSRKSHETGEYRPRSLASAKKITPEARWVSISVPGRFARRLADEAMDLGCHVFLYSDNVPLADEVELKAKAKTQGQLLMGPDCGSAIIGGIGFGFTNVIRRGPIGLVCASGTGLQAISSRIHQLGSGVSQAIGTGGRDLSSEVRGATTRQGMDLLSQDSETEVIVLASKPPAAQTRSEILVQALGLDVPVVVYFSGQAVAARRLGNLWFVNSLSEAADTAVALAQDPPEISARRSISPADGQYLRGLFAGGTLALEAVQVARSLLTPLYSNTGVEGTFPPSDPIVSAGHTILDLGADEYTVGRLHPMMDQRLRIERLEQEAADPETGLILLDVVLGRGSNPDPATDLAAAITRIQSRREVPVFIVIVGTDEDPQDLAATKARLSEAGAQVYTEVSEGLADAIGHCVPDPSPVGASVDVGVLQPPDAVINVGLEGLGEDLTSQGIETLQTDWRPPAGGDQKLMAILERMKR